MRKITQVVKTRVVFNKVWEMQVVQSLDSKNWQATYYSGAEEVIWCSGTEKSMEGAMQALDRMVDRFFTNTQTT